MQSRSSRGEVIMEAAQLKKFKEAMTQACKEHIEKGGTIISGKFQITETPTCKCPIVCFLGDQFRDNLMSKQIAEKLDIPFTTNDLWSFIYAFDGRKQDVCKDVNKDMWMIGEELRAEYIKEETK
jgi:hypothetical protein